MPQYAIIKQNTTNITKNRLDNQLSLSVLVFSIPGVNHLEKQKGGGRRAPTNFIMQEISLPASEEQEAEAKDYIQKGGIQFH